MENTESFELPTDAFLKPLSIPAIIDGAKTIEEAMIFGVYKGYSRSVSQINRINKAVDMALSRLDKINNANKAQNGEVDATNYSLQFVRTLAAGLSAAVVSIQNYEIITTNKLLTLLERSVSCYDWGRGFLKRHKAPVQRVYSPRTGALWLHSSKWSETYPVLIKQSIPIWILTRCKNHAFYQ